MWELRHKVRTLFFAMLAPRRPVRRSPESSVDWLPPVLGPNEWAIAMMADRSAGWYFDRDRP